MPSIKLSLQEIPLETLHRVRKDGAAIVIYRSADQIRAYEDVCPHAFWPISRGEVKEGVLECPGHGWTFEILTGKCINAPVYCLTEAQVTLEGDQVQFDFQGLSRRDRRSENQAPACP